MRTVYLKLDPANPDVDALRAPAAALREGKLVVMPTETVYGLGVNALMGDAVPEVYRVKGRPSDNPLIVHVADFVDIPPLVQKISPLADFIMHRFMPGPLTVILPKSDLIPLQVSGGLATVGIRMPSHPIAHALIKLAGVPVAAPSANLSGKPSLTNGPDCLEELSGKVPFIVDGGASDVGLESTVLDLTSDMPRILRPGKIDQAAVQAVCDEFKGKVMDGGQSAPMVSLGYLRRLAANEKPAAPGMKYRHYAPQAEVRIVNADFATGSSVARAMGEAYAACLKEYPAEEIGVFAAREAVASCLNVAATSAAATSTAAAADAAADAVSAVARVGLPLLAYGEYGDIAAAAHGLFTAFRALDRRKVKVILTHELPQDGIGAAYMNRLRKAAAKAQALPPVYTGDDRQA